MVLWSLNLFGRLLKIYINNTMNSSESARPRIFCPHGKYPDTCAICLEKSFVQSSLEAKAVAPIEFKINDVRGQITLLERESGHSMTDADLTFEQTITNKDLQRTTFVFKLNEQKAMEYFGSHAFYHFMNEPLHRPPRYEVERIYCNSDDSNDIMFAETVFTFVGGSWKKI